eukprot:3014867-Pyramimonas_sp.AAC.1
MSAVSGRQLPKLISALGMSMLPALLRFEMRALVCNALQRGPTRRMSKPWRRTCTQQGARPGAAPLPMPPAARSFFSGCWTAWVTTRGH